METKAAEAELVGLQPEIDNAQVLKDDLATSTKVAEFRLWVWNIAYGFRQMYTFFTQLKADVQEIEDAKSPPTDGWWKALILDFQENFELSWDTIKRRYLYSDTTSDAAIASRIVKFCSITDFQDTVLIKCAAADGGGLPLELDVDQLAKVSKYARRQRPPGTTVNVVSREPDLIKVLGTIYIDPLADEPTVTAAVEAAINNFDNYLEFDGTYNITKLVDNLQKVPGVREPYDIKVYYKYGLLTYTQITRQYQTSAGYVKVDPANPLSSTLTYIKDV